MHGDLLASIDERLRSLVLTVAGALEMEPDGRIEFDLGRPVQAQFEGPGPRPYYRIRSADGKVLIDSGTAGGCDACPPGQPPALEAPGPEPAGRTLGAAPGFRVFMLSRVLEPELDEDDLEEWRRERPGETLPRPAARELWVEVGLGLGGLQESLAAFRARLLPGFTVLFLVLAAVPVWAVRRALQPLETLSREAEAIHAENVGARLTEADADREVQALVRALNGALDRLAEAYVRQKRYTSDAAHELRTPLSVIRAQSEVALRKPREPAELRQALEIVHQTALRLTDLIEGLLTLSRHAAGTLRLERQPVDLASLAREALGLLSVAAEAKRIRLTGSFPGPVPAFGDPLLLQTCLLNLIENAVRFTPAGGEVRVDGSAAPAARISVRDSGPGIAADQQQKIFEPFYRVDAARTRADGGTGLGLAIAQEIARLHGGRIRVTSQPGSGSCFALELPGASD
jgi:heavy metal sensor kinase